jgi:hypothetical protein
MIHLALPNPQQEQTAGSPSLAAAVIARRDQPGGRISDSICMPSESVLSVV